MNSALKQPIRIPLTDNTSTIKNAFVNSSITPPKVVFEIFQSSSTPQAHVLSVEISFYHYANCKTDDLFTIYADALHYAAFSLDSKKWHVSELKAPVDLKVNINPIVKGEIIEGTRINIEYEVLDTDFIGTVPFYEKHSFDYLADGKKKLSNSNTQKPYRFQIPKTFLFQIF